MMGGGGMMGGLGYGGYGGFGGLGIIGMVLNLVITVGLIVAAVVLVIWLVRRLGQAGGTPFNAAGSIQNPREILQVRYARGEITRDQYKEMLSDLG